METFKDFSTKSTHQLPNYNWVIIKVFKEIREKTPSKKKIQVREDQNTSIKNHLFVLPYQGEKGIHIICSFYHIKERKEYISLIK